MPCARQFSSVFYCCTHRTCDVTCHRSAQVQIQQQQQQISAYVLCEAASWARCVLSVCPIRYVLRPVAPSLPATPRFCSALLSLRTYHTTGQWVDKWRVFCCFFRLFSTHDPARSMKLQEFWTEIALRHKPGTL